jgi:dihydrofolate reductase
VSKIYVANHVTLDGVMQGPGRADEDTRYGFAAGGWAAQNVDETVTEMLSARVARGGGMRMLLGRFSYDDMLGYWNTQDSPFTSALNNAEKYVVSRTLTSPLAWPNSTLVSGGIADLAALKNAPGADLCVMGSGQLIQTLMEHRLIDEFLLFVHPIVLGSGRRLFTEPGASAGLHLLEARGTPTGVIVAHYESIIE